MEQINHYTLLVAALQEKAAIKVTFSLGRNEHLAKTNFAELGEKYYPLHELAETSPHTFIYMWESARKYVKQNR